MNEWSFTNDRPIYRQLVEQLKLRILTGHYKPGERLPSVRELAGECMVNPNTLQRAMGELEGLGLITTQRTVGRVITPDEAFINSQRSEIAETYLGEFLGRMNSLGFTDSEIIEMLREGKNKNG